MLKNIQTSLDRLKFDKKKMSKQIRDVEIYAICKMTSAGCNLTPSEGSTA